MNKKNYTKMSEKIESAIKVAAWQGATWVVTPEMAVQVMHLALRGSR